MSLPLSQNCGTKKAKANTKVTPGANNEKYYGNFPHQIFANCPKRSTVSQSTQYCAIIFGRRKVLFRGF